MFLWPVVNHTALFLIPLGFDTCSSLLGSVQPQAQDARRQDDHMICPTPFLTYLSPKVDEALWDEWAPNCSGFTVLEEVTKGMFRNSRWYGKDTHAHAHAQQ